MGKYEDFLRKASLLEESLKNIWKDTLILKEEIEKFIDQSSDDQLIDQSSDDDQSSLDDVKEFHIDNHILKGEVNNTYFEKLPYSTRGDEPRFITPKYILVHWTAGWTAESTLQYLEESRAGSYHIIIDRCGKIYNCMPLNYRAWHAGVSGWRGYNDLNSHSIGIAFANRGFLYDRIEYIPNTNYKLKLKEIVGKKSSRNVPFPDAYYEEYTDEALNQFEKLVQVIRSFYGKLPVIGHHHVSPGRKSDPGPLFDFTKYL